MSGQQVGTIVGQVVGSYFGPVGAAIGGAIGGLVGGVFDPDLVNEGPRLTDLRIQTSNYGNAIPIIFGSYRAAGNIIWVSDIRTNRIEHEEGKGGPSVVNVEYASEVDVAIGLSDLEVADIERIYANGVLIYDTRSGASPQNVFASGQWARSTALYPGNSTQLPDPTIEAAVGVGNCPAYRFTAYLVIGGIQLNVLKTSVLPNFECVIIGNGASAVGRQLKQVSGIEPVYHNNTVAYQEPTPIITALGTTIRVANTDDNLVRLYDLDGVELGIEERTEEEFEAIPDYSTGSAPFHVWMTFDRRPTVATLNLPIGSGAVFTVGVMDMLDVVPSTDYLRGIVACADQRHYLILTSVGSSNISAWYLLEWDGEVPILHDQGTVDTTGLSINEANDWNQSPVYQYPAKHYVSMLESDLTHAWQFDHGNVAVWKIESGVLSRIIYFSAGILPLRNMAAAGSALAPAIFADKGLAALVVGQNDASTSWFFLYTRSSYVAGAPVLLTDILTELCDRAALDVSELTFVNLPDTVDGFAVPSIMNARAAIETLRPAYYFDGVDSDTFKFVKRGAASVVDIEYDDLGAGEGSPQTEVVTMTRNQETEIPARVNVKYLSMNADYQPAAQSARRETTGSRETAEVNLAIVFEDDNKAAEIADVLLRERWINAYQRNFVTTIDYAKYEPTDVVTVDDGFAVRTVRLTRRVDKSLLIEWESVDEDVAAYESNAIAAAITVPSQDLVVQGPTAFEVLDIAPLSTLPEGNESAAYVAAKGYILPWPGAAIDVSRNEGATYSSGTGVTGASVMGAALTALPDFLGGNVFDISSVVRVNVGAGTLANATTLEVLNGANGCVIGNEVLQFRDADFVSTGVYDLSYLLRGRKGSEWAMDDHIAGDRFVLLTNKLRNLPLELSDRALEKLYVRATTGNTLPTSGLVRSFEPMIARLMPYSPVHLNGTRDGSNDWTLNWVRRDRYANDWLDLVDIPMSETYELYDVEILDGPGGDVIQTYIDVATTTQVVPAAVYGPPYTSITFVVYQKSSLVGRGFAAEATLTQA
jgi:hypothetical protein